MPKHQTLAPLAELVDARDSKSRSLRSAGSIPAGGTIGLFFYSDLLSPTQKPDTNKAGYSLTS